MKLCKGGTTVRFSDSAKVICRKLRQPMAKFVRLMLKIIWVTITPVSPWIGVMETFIIKDFVNKFWDSMIIELGLENPKN